MSLSPDPRRAFGRPRRRGRTFSDGGVRTLIVAAVVAFCLARLFGAA